MAADFALYVATTGALVASHAVPSAPGIRPALIRGLGRRGFFAAYGTLSMVTLAAFVWTYLGAETGDWLYTPPKNGHLLAVLVMPLAVFLIVGRMTTPYGTPEAPNAPVGIYRICRFPGSFGLLIWSSLHLLNMGDARRTVLFATMVAIALIALAKNEWVRRRLARAGGTAYLDETALIPFAAQIIGRRRIVWGEIGWGRIALTLATYVGLLLGHPYAIGVDPLAGILW